MPSNARVYVRIAAAVAIDAVIFAGATGAAAIGLSGLVCLDPLEDFGCRTGRGVSVVLFIAATMLVLVTGPVTWAITRSRWSWLTPLSYPIAIAVVVLVLRVT